MPRKIFRKGMFQNATTFKVKTKIKLFNVVTMFCFVEVCLKYKPRQLELNLLLNIKSFLT